MENTKLSPPWVNYINKITALFGDDPEIVINANMSSEAPYITLFVDNNAKADAIRQLLPTSIAMGNVTLIIDVVPANTEDSALDILETAFKGNPAFSYVKHISTVSGWTADYCVFKKEVVQYYNDNLMDINGMWSGLYSELADELLQTEGVYYCTDTDV